MPFKESLYFLVCHSAHPTHFTAYYSLVPAGGGGVGREGSGCSAYSDLIFSNNHFIIMKLVDNI